MHEYVDSHMYIREDDHDLSEFTTNQTVIITKKFLPFLPDYNIIRSPDPPLLVEWYPLTNSYYPHTEEVDAFARVNHLIATGNLELENVAIKQCKPSYEVRIPYSEYDTQLEYLKSKPTSFLILGKPDIGQLNLGRILCEQWNCVYIDPEILIEEEIKSGSRAGSCIEFNLRCGRAIAIDVVLRLLQKRVKTETALHRGFVVCGFPLIQNDLYEEDPVSSETAVFTAQEIFEEIIDTIGEVVITPTVAISVSKTSKLKDEEGSEGGEGSDARSEASDEKLAGEEEFVEPETEPAEAVEPVSPRAPKDLPADVGLTSESICFPPTIMGDYERQLQYIFDVFDGPYMIIYVACPNADVVSKRASYRFNYMTQEVIDMQAQQMNKFVFTLFSKETGGLNELPTEFFDELPDTKNEGQLDLRYLLQVPKDFPACVVSQLDRYHYAVLKVIDRHVLMHPQGYYVKVDGRVSASRMFNMIKSKLRVTVPKAIIPTGMSDEPDETLGEGEVAEPVVEEQTVEECFEKLRKRNTAGPMFKWTWSNWGRECPVSMKEWSFKDGLPQFAVRFMNRIFFLSSEDAYIKFCRNPRPYLLPPYPKLTCKIFVMGPERSGKTAVSKCLGYLLEGRVLSPVDIKRQFFRQRQKKFREHVKSTALNEGIILLNKVREEEWAKKEEDRLVRVTEWKDQIRELLDEFFRLSDTKRNSLQEVSAFPMKLIDTAEEELKLESELALQRTISALSKLNIKCTDDDAQCRLLAERDEELEKHLRADLRQAPEPEPATVFDDFVKKYVDEAVRTADPGDLILTADSVHEIFREKIREVQTESMVPEADCKGWILDGIPLTMELLEKFEKDYLPEDVFMLEDEDPFDDMLERETKRGLNYFHDYRGLFSSLDMPDAVERTPSTQSTTSAKEHMASEIVHSIVDQIEIAEPEGSVLPLGEGEGEEGEEEEVADDGKESKREHYREYFKNMDEVCEALASRGVSVIKINIAHKSMEEVLKSVVKETLARYKFKASVFTPEDRVEEVEDLGEIGSQHGEGMGEEEEPTKDAEDLFAKSRRYGDTSFYCPVTYFNHWVLWRGKEEFAVKHENRLYLCATEANMKKFLEHPYDYLKYVEPPSHVPPPRICVVGPRSSGKSTIALAVAENFGFYYVNLKNELKNYSDELESDDEDTQPKRDAVSGFLSGTGPLTEELQNSNINKLWFEEPVRSCGFVLDSYPLVPTDIDLMIKNSWLPNMIIQLTANPEKTSERIIEKEMGEWKTKMDRQQRTQDELNRKLMNEWEEKRTARFNEMLEERRAKRYEEKLKEKTEDRPGLYDLKEVDEEVENKSQISFVSIDEQADIDEIGTILAEEMPEPVFEDTYETFEVAKARLEGEFENTFSTEMENLRIMREYCESELIPWTVVDGNLQLKQAVADAFRIVAPLKFMNISLFERCYEVSVELAEKLLATGYYFQSRFKRTCPVQYYDQKCAVQLFLPLEQKFRIFPVIHRNYIYFLAGKEALDRFKEHPLKFVYQPCVKFPLIPFRVALIGPPKCGKTTLAERFQFEYGFKIISRGAAVRYVLSHLRHSKLAEDMEEVLREGWELTDEMVMRSVEAAAYDSRAITQGIVYDGFPNAIGEVKHLADLGLTPNLILEVTADLSQVYECLENEVILKHNVPKYSERFIKYRFDERAKTADYFRNWFDREYQLLAPVALSPSKWSVWEHAKAVASALFFEVQFYYRNCQEDWPLRLQNMLISPQEFVERRSSYRHYCPACLFHTQTLRNGGEPPDRSAVIQFRRYFYWLCWEHIEEFMRCPEQYISPYNPYKLPDNLPERIYPLEKPKNVHDDGICVVCYKDNLPKKVFNEGLLMYAVAYKDEVFLFDTFQCMREFSKEPQLYAGITSSRGPDDGYPSLEYCELPSLGMLEQFVAKQVVRAVAKVANRRPIIAGLGPSASAAIYIGLLLKQYNVNTPHEFVALYKDAMAAMQERSDTLRSTLERMKLVINPYLYYEEPMPPFRLPEKKVDDEDDGQLEVQSVHSGKSSVLGIIEELMRRVVGDDK